MLLLLLLLLLCWQNNIQVFSIIISLYTTTVRQQWRSASNVATARFTCCSHCLLNCGFRSSSGWPPLLYSKLEETLSTSFMTHLSVFEEIDELSIVMHQLFLLESTIAHHLKLLQPSPHLHSSISTFVIASHLHLYLQSFPLFRKNFSTKFFKNFSFSSCLLFHQVSSFMFLLTVHLVVVPLSPSLRAPLNIQMFTSTPF
jgi:hypothetical protein